MIEEINENVTYIELETKKYILDIDENEIEWNDIGLKYSNSIKVYKLLS